MADQMNPDLPDDFDRLLLRELSVEPSAAFLPKVRERIAAQPPRPVVWWPWSLGFGLAAVVVLLAVWLKPQPSPVVAPATAQIAVAPKSEPSGPAVDDGRDVPGFHRGTPVRTRRQPAAAVPTARQEPVVMVDERQSAAVAAVYRLVVEGKLTSEAFAHTIPQSLEPIRNQLVPLSVPPLDVSPITVGGVLPTESERH